MFDILQNDSKMRQAKKLFVGAALKGRTEAMCQNNINIH